MIILKGVSWSVLPLLAGLFVIVEALNKTGLTHTLANILNNNAAHSVAKTFWSSGFSTAFVCNLVNNLPAGLIPGNVLQVVHMPQMVKNAVLIGVDLEPNFSVTGSLATILWLRALWREGETVTVWYFFLNLALLL